VPGHWGGDFVVRQLGTRIATPVQRSSRFGVFTKVDSRDMMTVSARLIRYMRKSPENARKTPTWDRGMELADHKTVAAGTGMRVHFAVLRSR
jgi:IS30 family transposase